MWGFGDIDETVYLDRLFVHKDYQKHGIVTSLCDELEKQVTGHRITVHATITAKPFFEKRGISFYKNNRLNEKVFFLQIIK